MGLDAQTTCNFAVDSTTSRTLLLISYCCTMIECVCDCRTETFRLCGSLLDGLAAASYNEWLKDREMTVGRSSVALKHLSSCKSNEFKVCNKLLRVNN